MIALNKSFLGRMLTIMLFVTLSIMGMIFSIYLFFVSNTFYMYALAGSFFLLSVIAGFFNLYASIWYFRSFFYDSYLAKIKSGLKKLQLNRLPTIAVAVPTYNEDPEMVETNITELLKMNYPKEKMHLFLLDDSTEETKVKAFEALSKKKGITFIHRNDRKGYKAGALNNMLNYSKDEYVAVFDADEFLTDKNFLLDTLPFFQDERLSYIQTEKRYQKHTFFSESVDTFDAFFFNFIQPARALNNTAVFAGSCGLIRRSALEDIGGFPEYVIEDTFFSFESDMHNYKSLYLPKVYALGRPIKTFTELAKQQWRYNYGDTQFISYFFKRKGFKKGSPFSNMDYITHGFGLNYLSVVMIMFTLVSIGIVFSAIPFAHINFSSILTQTQLAFYLELLGFFAFTLSMLTPVLLTKIYFKSFRKGFMVFLLNYALAFVRTKAAIATLLNTNPGIHWNRNKFQNYKSNLHYSLTNTKSEVTFAAVLFGLGAFALLRSNLSGGAWLVWYGMLYCLSTLLLYIYG